MGPELVKKSLFLIVANLGAALRATGVPMALGFGAAAVLVWLVGGPGAFGGVSLAPYDPLVPVPAPGRMEVRAATGLLLGAVPAIFGLLWAAVAWHRFVLLEEVPALMPPLRADRIGSYLWASIRLIGPALLIGLVVAIAAGLLVSIAAALESAPFAELMNFGLAILIAYAMLRFSLVLPAAAVGRSMGVFESWARTRGARDGVLVAAALLSVLNALIGLAGGALPLAGGVGVVLSLVLSWFGFMLGLSILTAIYGHVVDGRPLS